MKVKCFSSDTANFISTTPREPIWQHNKYYYAAYNDIIDTYIERSLNEWHILCCLISFYCNQLQKWRPAKCYATYPFCITFFQIESYFLRAIFTMQTQYLYFRNVLTTTLPPSKNFSANHAICITCFKIESYFFGDTCALFFMISSEQHILPVSRTLPWTTATLHYDILSYSDLQQTREVKNCYATYTFH